MIIEDRIIYEHIIRDYIIHLEVASIVKTFRKK